jgi:Fe-S-cluster-containing dehydrogenase component
MARRYAMAIDLRTCLGCAGCVIACMTENESFGYSRCRVTEETRGNWPKPDVSIYSERCNHCTDPPCVPVCPTGASHVAEHGLVEIDQSICTGCKTCMAACPYDSRFLNASGVASKCSFCSPRLEKGLPPFCVSQCPSRAMVFGDLNDANSEIRKLLDRRPYRVRKPESGTRPHVFYLEAKA